MLLITFYIFLVINNFFFVLSNLLNCFVLYRDWVFLDSPR